ncbi:MAG: alpha/beta fold hydrolase BchO [Pseudomonadota bacterium]
MTEGIPETWPHAGVSRFVTGPVHRWHVQETGAGDDLLLLHGAGGSTHSFRHMIPLLAQSFRVIALDLPGHGFTKLGARHRSGLSQMATDITALARQEGWTPRAIVGHSSGAAVALRMARHDLSDTPPHVIGLNAALEEFSGLARLLFPVMAKALSLLPGVSALFSGTASNPARVAALLEATGSKIDAAGVALYRDLVARRAHVDGTLMMMAQWNLRPLLADLPNHHAPVDFIVGSADTTVPPDVSKRAAQRMPYARIHCFEGLGHLSHEEKPDQTAQLITDILTQQMA